MIPKQLLGDLFLISSPVQRNPLLDNDKNCKHHWRVKLINRKTKRQLTFFYSDHLIKLTVKNIIVCFLYEVGAIDKFPKYNNWLVASHVKDTPEAKKTYSRLKKLRKKLMQFFGKAGYQTLQKHYGNS